MPVLDKAPESWHIGKGCCCLCEMIKSRLPVPPGSEITVAACKEALRQGVVEVDIYHTLPGLVALDVESAEWAGQKGAGACYRRGHDTRGKGTALAPEHIHSADQSGNSVKPEEANATLRLKLKKGGGSCTLAETILDPVI